MAYGRHYEKLCSVQVPIWGRSLRPWAISRYLNTHSATRKLQIGCQLNVLPGWLNTDLIPLPRGVVYMDATRRFPFPDQTFDYAFSEHMIEHVPLRSGCFMLRECFRVLKPGGKLRIATPNLRALVALLGSELTEVQRQYVIKTNSWAWGITAECMESHHAALAFNYQMHLDGSHHFIWDLAMLRAILTEIGFGDVVETKPCVSDDSNLQNVEYHWRFTGHDLNSLETLIVEARRPGPNGM